VGALLSDLLARGLDFSTPRLYVLDGSKALHTAVRRHAGESAFLQRCQVHKKRNVASIPRFPNSFNLAMKNGPEKVHFLLSDNAKCPPR
jgi:hypothetical protein